jgi:hypothetical protein
MFKFLKNTPKCQCYAGLHFILINAILDAGMNSTDSYSIEHHKGHILLVASTHIIFCFNDFWQPTTVFSTIGF